MPLLPIGGRALGFFFRTVPRGNFDCNTFYINKDELNTAHAPLLICHTGCNRKEKGKTGKETSEV